MSETRADAPATGSPALALVVEDEAPMRRFLRAALESAGYRVVLAETGADGLREAASRSPDVVVLDLGLPDLDGYEVASRLRGQAGLERSAIIAISGYGQAKYLTRSAEAGFSHHIVKPVDMAHLNALLTALEKSNRG